MKAKAYPAKRFFVEMLTRDIELDDAILDLLDNCVDGAIRSGPRSADGAKPYSGYKAKIEISDDHFEIMDNCGGIEKQLAMQSAFRFGRPDAERDKELATVGVYGIGMKRAIFKLGTDCTIKSAHSDACFEVKIDRNWMEDDNIWELELSELDLQENLGTQIRVNNLHDPVKIAFNPITGNFSSKLKTVLEKHYGFIISKGFSIYLNDEIIVPQQVQTIIDPTSFEKTSGIAPYIYQTEHEGVTIDLVMGLYQKLPTEAEMDDSETGKRNKENAGWTIICNDRVVVSNDKSHLTGWGEAGVPQYHSQFIALSGVVIFTSKDAKKLPVTTTKRGIDQSSQLYSFVKEEMRRALKTFTDFTNNWKSQTEERAEIQAEARPLDITKAILTIPAQRWTNVMKGAKGRRFTPTLPKSSTAKTHSRIQFSKPNTQIEAVRAYLFDAEDDSNASDIGAAAFDWVFKKAAKK